MQKKYRLKGRKVFNFVLNKGESVPTKAFVLIYSQSKFPTRAGFIVSKKIGKAVVRNKMRRRLKEAFRSLIPEIKNNFNFVIIARSEIVNNSYQQILSSLVYALRKAKLFKEDKHEN